MKRFSLVLVIIFFTACPGPKRQVTSITTEQWMGVYLKNEKIGYSYSQLQKKDNNYQFINRFKIKLAMMGNQEEIVSNFTGVTDTNYCLTEFDFSFQSLKNSFNARGGVKQNQLVIEVKSGGSIKSITHPVNDPIYPVAVLSRLVVKKKFEINKEYSINIFDATILKVVDAKIKLLNKEQIKINEKNYDVTKMTISMLGLTTIIWFDKYGIERKEESQPGLTIIEETREQALVQEGTIGKLDILSMFSVPVDTIINEPRELKYLKIEINGINTEDLKIADDGQTVQQVKPLIIEIKINDSLLNARLPLNQLDEFLKATLCVQSDNKDIQEQAKNIIKQEKDAVKASKLILNWVYENIDKRATASLPSALDVLKNKQGDCNEHAVFFTALCRAVGIPCQICVGLVYVEGRFYYHAWNKVFLNQWVSVDPTFGQFPIDATHIKFAEGELEEQAKVLKIVGEIKIKVLAFK
jgi:hypothetical protein